MDSEVQCNDVNSPPASEVVSNCDNLEYETFSSQEKRELCHLENELEFNNADKKNLKKNVCFESMTNILYFNKEDPVNSPKKNLPVPFRAIKEIPSPESAPSVEKLIQNIQSDDDLVSQMKKTNVVQENLPSCILHHEIKNGLHHSEKCQKTNQFAASSNNSNLNSLNVKKPPQNVTNSVKSCECGNDMPSSELQEIKQPVKELRVILQPLPSSFTRMITGRLNSKAPQVTVHSKIDSKAELIQNSNIKKSTKNKLRVNKKAKSSKKTKQKFVKKASSKKTNRDKLSEEVSNCFSPHASIEESFEPSDLRISKDDVKCELKLSNKTDIYEENSMKQKSIEGTGTHESHHISDSQKLLPDMQRSMAEYQDCFSGLSNKIPIVLLEKLDIPVPIIDTNNLVSRVTRSKAKSSPISLQNHLGAPELLLNSKLDSNAGVTNFSDKSCKAKTLVLHELQSSQDHFHQTHKRLCVHLEKLDLGVHGINPKLFNYEPEQNLPKKSLKNPFLEAGFNKNCWPPPHSNGKKQKKLKNKKSIYLKDNSEKHNKSSIKKNSQSEEKVYKFSRKLPPLTLNYNNTFKIDDIVSRFNERNWPTHLKRKKRYQEKKRKATGLNQKLKNKSQQCKNSSKASSQFEQKSCFSRCPEKFGSNTDFRIDDNATSEESLPSCSIIIDNEVPFISSCVEISQNEIFLPKNKLNSVNKNKSLLKKSRKKSILHSNSFKKSRNNYVEELKHLITNEDSSSDSSSIDNTSLLSLVTADFATTLSNSLSKNLKSKSHQHERSLVSSTDDSSDEINHISSLLKVDSLLNNLTEKRKKKESFCSKSVLTNVNMDHCYNQQLNFQDVTKAGTNIQSKNKESFCSESILSRINIDHCYMQKLNFCDITSEGTKIQRKNVERIHADHNYQSKVETDHSYHLPLDSSTVPQASQINSSNLQTPNIEEPVRRSVRQKRDVSTSKKFAGKQNAKVSNKSSEGFKAKNSDKSKPKKKLSHKKKIINKKVLREKQAKIYDLIVEYLQKQIKSKSSKKKLKKKRNKQNSDNFSGQRSERQVHLQCTNITVTPEIDCSVIIEPKSNNVNMCVETENYFSDKTLLLNTNKKDRELILSKKGSDCVNSYEFNSCGINLSESGENFSRKKSLQCVKDTEKRLPLVRSLKLNVETDSVCDAVNEFDSRNTNLYNQSGSSFSGDSLSPEIRIVQVESLSFKTKPGCHLNTDATDEFSSRNANMHGQGQSEICLLRKFSTPHKNQKERHSQALSLGEKSHCIADYGFDSLNSKICVPSKNSFSCSTLSHNGTAEEKQSQSLSLKDQPESDYSTDTADELSFCSSLRPNATTEEIQQFLDIKVEPESDSADEFNSRNQFSSGSTLSPTETINERQQISNLKSEPESDSSNDTTDKLSSRKQFSSGSTLSPNETTEERQQQFLNVKVEPESDCNTDSADERSSKNAEIFNENGNSSSHGACVSTNKSVSSKGKKKSVDKYRLGFLSGNKSLRSYNKCFASERLLLSKSKLQKKQMQKLKKLFKNLKKVCHVKKV